jgi:four helix bundle protein
LRSRLTERLVPIKSYRDLIVWQTAMDLAADVHRLVKRLAPNEPLADHLRRAALSVAANIAEGYGRGSRAEYARYVGIANGSLKEVETLCLFAERVGLLPPKEADLALRLCESTGRMLNRLRRRLREPPKPQAPSPKP